jgi:soluble lytic murein transglycosylase
VLDATLAYVHAQLGDLRRGAIYMKRAYPQYIAAGGERLPVELRRIIFPLGYAELIATYSRSRGLDPSLVSALIAQESAFQADAKSSANAYGLMQIVPRTGRRLARQDGLRRFSTRMLVDPKINVRLGTRYFAQLVGQFSGVHLALAGYNAGESRVRLWTSERAGLPVDEFVDDIPFPETQSYVKRILSMAEDYRELYGAELDEAARSAPAAVRPASRPAPPLPHDLE